MRTTLEMQAKLDRLRSRVEKDEIEGRLNVDLTNLQKERLENIIYTIEREIQYAHYQEARDWISGNLDTLD